MDVEWPMPDEHPCVSLRGMLRKGFESDKKMTTSVAEKTNSQEETNEDAEDRKNYPKHNKIMCN
jgi:hypothetical protein